MEDRLNNSEERQSASAVAGDVGLPIAVVLESLAEDLDDREMREAVQEILPQLNAGKTIDEALNECQRTIPPYLTGLMRAASSGEKLAETCDSLVRIRDASHHTWYSMRAVMAYPVVLLVALIAVSLLFAWYVVPPFESLFQEFDLELPQATEFYLSTANLLPITLMGILLLFLLVTLGPRLLGIGFAIRSAVPVIGKLYTSLAHEEFSTILACFVRLETPLHEALGYTSGLLKDRGLARATSRVALRVQKGSPLADAMHSSRSFDRSLAVITGWGEVGSQLAESLELAADMYAERRRQRLFLLKRIIPPLALVAVATMALSGAAVLLLPLVKLIEGLS